jgi:hypothetical protein
MRVALILNHSVLLLTTLLLLLILMSDYFKCNEKCGRLFSAPGGLTRHRKSCLHWQQQLTKQSLHFKQASEVMQGAPAAKKIKLGHHIVEVSTTSIASKRPSLFD